MPPLLPTTTNLFRRSLLSSALRPIAPPSSKLVQGSIRAASSSTDERPQWKKHEIPWSDWHTSTNPDFTDKRYPVKEDADPQLFGYPELPTEYTMLRDPRKGWWDQDERRNFGEIIQHEDDFTGPFGPDVQPDAPLRYFFYSFGTLFGAGYLAYLYEDYVYEYPVQVDREYPYNGLLNAKGGEEWSRMWVYKGIDPRDEFHGSSRDYYLGPLPAKDSLPEESAMEE